MTINHELQFSNDFQSVIGGKTSVYSSSVTTFRNIFREDTTQSRMGRTISGESARPMTAVAGAGFQSQSKFNNIILYSFFYKQQTIMIFSPYQS